VFPFLAQVEVGTSLERAKEGSEFKRLLCRRPPFGPDFHQQGLNRAFGFVRGALSPKGYAAARFPGKRPRAARPHGCLGGWGWGSARGASVSSRRGKGIVSPNPKWEAPSQKKPRQGEGTPRRTVAVASLNWHLG
jgi:hypothetical protein